MLDHLGELAALGTSVCYSFGSMLFTFSGHEIGTALTNRARLLIALVFVIALHLITLGTLFPITEPMRWFWLGLSGIIGFAIGDACLFEAFVRIGPRLSMLMMAFAPALSVVFAWIFLGETLTLADLLIIAVITAGIIWVVAERTESREEQAEDQAAAKGDSRQHLIGILFGVGAATGQAGGFILSKIGLADNFPALSATLIRLLIATLVVWAISAVRRELGSSFRELRAHPRAFQAMVLASVLGPVLGVWLSLVAVQNISVGVSSTLSSLAPILLIPIGYFLYHEKVSRRAIIGTIVVIIASAFLFF